MKPSSKQMDLLHETSLAAMRKFCKDNNIAPTDINTIIEVGEPNKIECKCKGEPLVSAEIDDDVLTIKMNYKLPELQV